MKRKTPTIKQTVTYDLLCDIREAAGRGDRVLPLGSRMYNAKFRLSYYGSVVISVCREMGYPIAKMRDLPFNVAGVHGNAAVIVLDQNATSMMARLIRAVGAEDYEQAAQLRDSIHGAGYGTIHLNP